MEKQEKRDVTKPVETPCIPQGQGDTADAQTASTVAASLFASVPLPQQTDKTEELITICAEAEDRARQLEHALRTKIGTDIVGHWKDVHLQLFSLLNSNDAGDGTRTGMDNKDAQNTRHDGFERDIIHVKTVRIYLKQIQTDDEEKSNSEFKDHLSPLCRKMEQLLCHLIGIVKQEPDVTDDAMPDYERNINATAERLQRDYIFARDLSVVLKNKKDTYIQNNSKSCTCS